MKKSTKIIAFGLFAYFLLNSKKDEPAYAPPIDPNPPMIDEPVVVVKNPNSPVRITPTKNVIML